MDLGAKLARFRRKTESENILVLQGLCTIIGGIEPFSGGDDIISQGRAAIKEYRYKHMVVGFETGHTQLDINPQELVTIIRLDPIKTVRREKIHAIPIIEIIGNSQILLDLAIQKQLQPNVVITEYNPSTHRNVFLDKLGIIHNSRYLPTLNDYLTRLVAYAKNQNIELGNPFS